MMASLTMGVGGGTLGDDEDEGVDERASRWRKAGALLRQSQRRRSGQKESKFG
jgi:hypothetical protein